MNGALHVTVSGEGATSPPWSWCWGSDDFSIAVPMLHCELDTSLKGAMALKTSVLSLGLHKEEPCVFTHRGLHSVSDLTRVNYGGHLGTKVQLWRTPWKQCCGAHSVPNHTLTAMCFSMGYGNPTPHAVWESFTIASPSKPKLCPFLLFL